MIDDRIDTGNVLLQEAVQIFPFENAGDLHDRLMIQGARLVIRTLTDLTENKIAPLSQAIIAGNGKALKLAPKIHPDDCIINWYNDTMKIHNLVRGLAPYPCAKSWLQSESNTFSFKIFESRPEIGKHNSTPGTIASDGRSYFRISCKDGNLNIVSLQIEGKKRMNTAEFLRGFKLADFTIPVIQPA
jgi:methionyl-tRNA formyltransferase